MEEEKLVVETDQQIEDRKLSEAIELVLKGPGMIHRRVYVAWIRPNRVDEFKFPYAVIKIFHRGEDGRISIYGKATHSHESVDDLSLEIFSDFIHPNERCFLAREIFDQFREITMLNQDYHDAYVAYRDHVRKTEGV